MHFTISFCTYTVLVYLPFFFAVSCLSCPVGQYPSDRPGLFHVCVSCPSHTTTSSTPDVAVSAHDCKCEAGFLCMYYRQVKATVTLNTTIEDFESDSHGVRSTFLSGVASAAGVSNEQVKVHFVVIRLNHRRRLYAYSTEHEVVRISVTVSGTNTESLTKLHSHLSSFHMASDSWEVSRRVLVLAIPTKGI